MSMNEVVTLAWGAKEILRGDYKKSKYGEIILPFVVLRRLGRVLEPTKEKILSELNNLKGNDERLVNSRLNKITGHPFHNKSKFDLELLLADPKNIHKNIKEYIRGFSENVRDVFDSFGFNETLNSLQKQNLLYQIVQQFAKASLDAKTIDNHLMGTIYEELIRRTSEAANEEAGDHFTPREVIKLMVNLLFSHDKKFLKQKGLIRSIYDPAAGTGGMLSIASEYINEINSEIIIDAYGEELNPQSYAICKSDMMLKGLDLNKVARGNSLIFGKEGDAFPNEKFHYMLSNPPFGVDWGKYEKGIKDEADKGFDGKYGGGLPRKSDGSLLFLMHMISKMKSKEDGGSRIAIVLNASPLFTGEVGSGESRIRKWIIENDMLESIIALPNQLFYNTGIFTYIWIVTNNKDSKRKGKVQLINAVSFYDKMKSSLGNKRNIIPDSKIQEITNIFESCVDNEFSKILNNTDFGYTRVTIERPLKRNFKVDSERLLKLKQDSMFKKIINSNQKSKDPTQKEILSTLKKLPNKTYTDYNEFLFDLKNLFLQANFSVSSTLEKIIIKMLSEKDENAIAQKDSKGNLISDSELRDNENIPLKDNIDKYFENKVKPYVPDAWIDNSTRENVGYEIPFKRNFYEYAKYRSLEKIDQDIIQLQNDISTQIGNLATHGDKK